MHKIYLSLFLCMFVVTHAMINNNNQQPKADESYKQSQSEILINNIEYNKIISIKTLMYGTEKYICELKEKFLTIYYGVDNTSFLTIPQDHLAYKAFDDISHNIDQFKVSVDNLSTHLKKSKSKYEKNKEAYYNSIKTKPHITKITSLIKTQNQIITEQSQIITEQNQIITKQKRVIEKQKKVAQHIINNDSQDILKKISVDQIQKDSEEVINLLQNNNNNEDNLNGNEVIKDCERDIENVTEKISTIDSFTNILPVMTLFIIDKYTTKKSQIDLTDELQILEMTYNAYSKIYTIIDNVVDDHENNMNQLTQSKNATIDKLKKNSINRAWDVSVGFAEFLVLFFLIGQILVYERVSQSDVDHYDSFVRGGAFVDASLFLTNLTKKMLSNNIINKFDTLIGLLNFAAVLAEILCYEFSWSKDEMKFSDTFSPIYAIISSINVAHVLHRLYVWKQKGDFLQENYDIPANQKRAHGAYAIMPFVLKFVSNALYVLPAYYGIQALLDGKNNKDSIINRAFFFMLAYGADILNKVAMIGINFWRKYKTD